MANRVQAAMGHEGRAQTYAKDEIVPERVEALGILERGRLRRRLVLHHFESKGVLLKTDAAMARRDVRVG